MTETDHANPAVLHRTVLHALHVEWGAKMVPFAGYDMPVQYPGGIIAEHLHTRGQVGLFDVSHMGQAFLTGPDAAQVFERLVPADVEGLAENAIRYTQFLDPNGNILDDLMVTRLAADRLFLVVNAARKHADFAHIRRELPDLTLTIQDSHALLAVQGPAAAAVLERLVPGVGRLPFMTMAVFRADGFDLRVSRSGYTGEDGFEISLPEAETGAFACRLLGEAEVKPIGLGARDTLRLEAGLCLYGHDIDTTTTPLEAALGWSIGRRRWLEGGFLGEARLRAQRASGVSRKRVGLALQGRAPAREGSAIATPDGKVIGKVTSGGFAPSLGAPVAMGYVDSRYASPGTDLAVIVRGKPLAATVTTLPFVPHRYFRHS